MQSRAAMKPRTPASDNEGASRNYQGAITPNKGAIADNRLIFGDSLDRYGFLAEPNIRTDLPNIRFGDDRYEQKFGSARQALPKPTTAVTTVTH